MLSCETEFYSAEDESFTGADILMVKFASLYFVMIKMAAMEVGTRTILLGGSWL